jgi:hypothetical protein
MNEPVTWATEDLQNVMSPKFKEMRMDTNSSTYKQFPIPLYTHPPMRELSDKEIFEEAKKWGLTGLFSERQFARAIIKASRGEK